MKKSIFAFSREKLSQDLINQDEKPFRAVQIFEWIYRKKARSFLEMSNVAKKSQEKLEALYSFDQLEVETWQESADGTKKFLFRLADGNFIETVLMHFNYGDSVCISTQVGCNMGCAFCASGINKRKRNLTVDEMVLQVLSIDERLREENKRVSHIVIMGIGEPFDNYENVIDFIQIMNDNKGLEIGARHITLSTCGIVPKIKEFALLPLQINLAISLHFPTNEQRNKYMPINHAYPLEELFSAIRFYYEKTNRRITFEYILMDSINDSLEDAGNLVKLVRGLNCYVNLIPMNSTKPEWRRSLQEKTDAFYDYLMKNNVSVTLRKEQGHDIDAACGQLRIKRETQKWQD